jgi:peptidoglycan hydrolase-like protein with peptidoglycan-binding domain
VGLVAGVVTLAMLLLPPTGGAERGVFYPSDPRPPAAVSYGDEGPWVAELNLRLAEVGFHPDEEAVFGRRTRHAVFAFQKHYDLPTDGVFTTQMWSLLEDPIVLPVRKEQNRVEVDLGKQVLYLVEDGRVSLVVPVSSGNGATYRNSRGGYSRATTPEGKFTFQRKVNGVRRSYLGTLYNPFYFRGGYAIHGSPSVPNYPASHGCIRLTNWDIDLVKTRIALGWTIYVYGKRTDPPAAYVVPNLPPTLF